MSEKGQAKRDAREQFESIRQRIIGGNESIKTAYYEDMIVALVAESDKNRQLSIDAINEQARGEGNDAEYFIKYNKVFNGLIDTWLSQEGMPSFAELRFWITSGDVNAMLAYGFDPDKLVA